MNGIARSAGLTISAGRAAFGAAMIAAPTAIGEAWIGEPGRYERVALLTRSLGARDVALGAGAAAALARGDENAARLLLGGQALSDVADFAGTLAVRERLPDGGVRWTLALAGVSAIAAGLAAALLD
jgi:hypothetical protein